MALIQYKEFPKVGLGFTLKTQSISPSGLLAILRMAKDYGLFRLSKDGGKTFSEWKVLSDEVLTSVGKITETFDLVLDFVDKPFQKSRGVVFKTGEQSNVIYNKTIFKTFFDSDNQYVMTWAVNVLEKLFESGIVPLYVSRKNEDDYNSFFLAISHYFAFIVIYSRQFRQLENSDLLMKEFIEGWGLVYENIDTFEQRQYLFNNWIQEFYKRGTSQVVETGGTIEGELRRLVGYEKPNEFLFAVLSPQDVGWCVGWSSPTWYGTETVNAVSKGWDFGPDYAGDSFSDLITFDNEQIEMEASGAEVENSIYSEYPWKIYTNEDIPSDSSQSYFIGVGPLKDYPIIGDVKRKFVDNMYVFQPVGSGRAGISTEEDTSKAIEVYPGMNYEVTVWVKALNVGSQNIEFGVKCYDANFNLINQVRITDWRETNSFFTGDQYQSPCKVPGIYYRLRGIIYNLEAVKDESLYLNFENGRPLRFMGGVSYMAPYIVQNRDMVSADIQIAGITLKPLDLPFSQGYLGQKNVIAMYAQIRSARTKSDIESFIKQYLVSYKNIVSYTWLDWVVRNSFFLTFYVTQELDGKPVENAEVTLNNGFKSYTDDKGYVRFEIQKDTNISWTILAKGISEKGSVTMTKDTTVNVVMNLPLDVDIEIVQPTWGTAKVEGSRLPRTEITLTATPNEGYTFIKWNIVTDEVEDTRNPTTYWIGDHPLYIQAIFERNSGLTFEPQNIVIPAEGGVGHVTVTASKGWEIDPPVEDWLKIEPMSGGEGETDIRIEIDQEG